MNSRWADPGMACCCARRGLDTPQTQGGGLRFVGLIYFWGGTNATTDIIFRLNPEENRIKGYAWELFRLFAVVVNCLLGGQSCLANWAGLDFDDDWVVVVVDGCHPGAVERAC